MTVEVVHEDSDIIVLNKGRCVHTVSAADKPDEFTVESFLSQYNAELSELPENGLVQRLDFYTNGLLVAAKNADAREFLIEDQKLSRFTKAYRVIAEGHVPAELEVLRNKIALIKNSKTVKVFEPLQQIKLGRKARPFQVRLSVSNIEHQKEYSVVELYGQKLTRHQVRAQMAFIGHPLVGDTLYGSKHELRDFNFEYNEGFLLTAFKLVFRHPKTLEQGQFSI